jgi:release factor glutamine methyltransferase
MIEVGIQRSLYLCPAIYYLLYVTVLEAIQEGDRLLCQNGVENSRLEAELLLEQYLAHKRLEFPLIYGRVLPPSLVEAFRQSVDRRAKHEPIQHILGSASFCGFEIEVNPMALIPRPETELLAERAWTFLARSSGPENKPVIFLDIGTGTGCLPIAILGYCPSASAHAVDISRDALELARKNAGRHGMSGSIHFHLGDGFKAIPPEQKFDLVVSNPPYIPTEDIESLSPEVRIHDPRLALDGGPDGLDFYRLLANETASCLKPGGALMFEFGDGQAPAISRLFLEKGWHIVAIERDYARKERLMEVKRFSNSQ